MTVEPKRTIYINNINEKVSINKVRSALGILLQKFTPISISVAKTLKLKGQAFVTFPSIDNASKAIETLNNQEVFNQRINATFAELNSDTLLNKDELKQIRRKRQDEYKIKKQSTKTKSSKPATTKSKIKKTKQTLPPNRTLLLQNISSSLPVSKESLNEYFQSFAGFEVARYLGVRNLSFVDFENEDFAKACLQSVDENDMKEKFGDDIQLSYAKK